MKRLASLLALCLLVALPAAAQPQGTINITIVDAGNCATANACASFTQGTNIAVTIDVSGTWTGTLTFEGTVDGTNWRTITVTKLADLTTATTTTANGSFALPNTGLAGVRLRATATITGTAVVAARSGFARLPGGGAAAGVLAMANGGTDNSTAADDSILISSGAAWQVKAVPNCLDSGGNHLNYTASTNSLSCGTTGSGGGGAWTFVSSTSAAGLAQVDQTNLSAYNELMVLCAPCVSSTTAVIQMLVSTDNGSTFLNASGDYLSIDTTTFAAANDTTLSSSNNSTGTRYCMRIFSNFNAARAAWSNLLNAVGANATYFLPGTTARNAVRVRVNTGTFTSGTVLVYGR